MAELGKPAGEHGLPNSWFDEPGLVNLKTYEVGILHHFWEK